MSVPRVSTRSADHPFRSHCWLHHIGLVASRVGSDINGMRQRMCLFRFPAGAECFTTGGYDSASRRRNVRRAVRSSREKRFQHDSNLIRSDASDSALPADGVRLVPPGYTGANVALNRLARLKGIGGQWKTTPVLTTAPGRTTTACSSSTLTASRKKGGGRWSSWAITRPRKPRWILSPTASSSIASTCTVTR